jgi:hypothetical protein
MMDVARSKKELYSLLDVVDLTKPFPKTYLDNTYDAMLCSGVFLQGHVGPEAIPELSRVVKPNGMLCFTVRPTFFEETKEKWLLALEESGVDLIETKMLDYCPNTQGTHVVLSKKMRSIVVVYTQTQIMLSIPNSNNFINTSTCHPDGTHTYIHTYISTYINT